MTVWSKWTNRIRQNHALEHATINLLSRRFAGAHAMGISGPSGFTLYSTLTAEEIIPTARAALTALQGGAASLAVHENCGTNLVITAAATTLATLLGLGYIPDPLKTRQESGRRAWLSFAERLPQAVLLNVVALIVATPVAHWVQANVTTSPDVDDLEIASVFTDYRGGMSRVRVRTRTSGDRGFADGDRDVRSAV
jgi:hypothetical protein